LTSSENQNIISLINSMTEKNNSDRETRLLVIAAALVIIIGSINQAKPILASFLVAVFLSVIGTPPAMCLK
jgi:predicted PurR-regulated permease PerM